MSVKLSANGLILLGRPISPPKLKIYILFLAVENMNFPVRQSIMLTMLHKHNCANWIL